jgi:uncharacterized membrane protein
MRTSTKLILTILLLTIFLSKIDLSLSQTQTADSTRNQIHEAYKSLIDAYNFGGNITEITNDLNQALNLTSQAEAVTNNDPNKAQTLIQQAKALTEGITSKVVKVKDQGLQQTQTNITVTAAVVAALIAAGISVFLFGPKAIWKTWLRLRRNYRIGIKQTENKNQNLILTGKEACAIVLAILVIIAFFAASQTILQQEGGESFSELGILGTNMQLGDYPSKIVAGETVNLNIYVGNQMRKPIDYIVKIKLGNNKTVTDSATAETIQQFEQIIPQNQTWIFPTNITLTQPALNQRLIFELWIYNETSNQNQYHNRWDQIWLNVTAAAT